MNKDVADAIYEFIAGVIMIIITAGLKLLWPGVFGKIEDWNPTSDD